MVGKKKEEQWKLRLNELKAYKKKHGDCLVPFKYEHNRTLGTWVSTQRKEYKKLLRGVHSQLSKERINQLNEIDFEWEVGKRDDILWKQHFNKLVKYKKKHGDCLVPQRYEQNAKLRIWVFNQRQEYKKWLNGESASITQERINQLNEIDFAWEVGRGAQKDDTMWKQRLNKLDDFSNFDFVAMFLFLYENRESCFENLSNRITKRISARPFRFSFYLETRS